MDVDEERDAVVVGQLRPPAVGGPGRPASRQDHVELSPAGVGGQERDGVGIRIQDPSLAADGDRRHGQGVEIERGSTLVGAFGQGGHRDHLPAHRHVLADAKGAAGRAPDRR